MKSLVPRGKTVPITRAQATSVRDFLKECMKTHAFKSQRQLADLLEIRYPRINNLMLMKGLTLAETEIEKITSALKISREALLGVSDSSAALPVPHKVIDLSGMANDGTKEDDEEEAIMVELEVGKIRIRIEARA